MPAGSRDGVRGIIFRLEKSESTEYGFHGTKPEKPEDAGECQVDQKGQQQMENETKQQNLEELFSQVEAIVEQMEDNEISLEDSFLLYEQGIRKLRECNERIDRVEKKMLILTEQGEVSQESGE